MARWRRMPGLLVFFYASLHLLAYAWFDQGLVLTAVVDDVIKQLFILVGMLGWGVLLLLAATSFKRAVRGLSARRWQLLHRAVWGLAGLVVLHFYRMRSGKNDFAEVALYAAMLGHLLAWRVWRWVQGSRRSSRS
jgi:sulfoxide reductase heme-binding subunit YedZ